jgi:cobalt-zinc-cadmium resistance protein CzcA
MINQIIAFSVRNKLIIALFTCLIIGWGLYSLSNIPIDAVPDITNNQVQIITTSESLAAQEVEQYITYPVELAMNNLPGVQEIRSISRFGLSIVTVVFEEDMGTYLPRQLVNEKLKEAEQNIGAEYGSPQMGPITTGLGEIYQYTVEAKPGYENNYDATELRTIQDWIIKRQLSGTKGIVEINSWGGYLKQYEIGINPNKLNGFDLTLSEVFTALQKNNQNTGGSYIEKGANLYFIRGNGLVKSIDEIKKIVVTKRNQTPITIDDVAKVRIGHAPRFGAATKDGKGETVIGIVLMLKGANTIEVIQDVKNKIAAIQKTLPEGVVIKPFVNRTKLIGKTTSTIQENLMVGGLIVIFALVFLLGNFRSGLIVASVIPLSMLFALGMMNAFGVSANLMSLGALDFGIIVDGAVIIVEFMAVQLVQKNTSLSSLTKNDKRSRINDIAIDSSSRMMNSAIFGQIIILIVFLPILSLQGVEGKMFKPMALTFGFAILGAMILCLTYVPMISAWLLYQKPKKKKSWGDRFMLWLEELYTPILAKALKLRAWVLAVAITLLAATIFLFLNLGGEFIPRLEEGDFALETRMTPGTSLQEMEKSMTKLEQILLQKFPEVEAVVTKIGAAEVPTDPMPIEGGDIMIKLKDKSEWVSASTSEELANQMDEAIATLPGISVEFSQPIEMRFNELLTGIKSDLAIKIYGEDLSKLQELGNEAADLIEGISGAADVRAEQIAGLPQVVINYKRDRIAQYNLTIADLNQAINTAFSGAIAGRFFEGEKRFDIALRLQKTFRQDISSINALYIPLPNGKKVPLEEVADIQIQDAPGQISRDNIQRRIVIGVNVRNRDIQSLVDEIKQVLNKKLDLPPGYYITYGGQFENLQRASKRLSIVIPIALALIFFILYISLRSIKETILIYTAIPFAAVGGVFALWIRGMPFSISAGVGFIALFGVAVLNGLVLISSLNELKVEGVTNIKDRILKATTSRLRPIFLTASTDIFGFLPMAVSTSAGAEVQRPLATVVIGGILTATLLTLIVLPILYTFMQQPPKINKAVPLVLVIFVMGLLPNFTQAQTVVSNNTINLETAIDSALANNPGLKANQYRIESQKALKGTGFDLPKTNVGFEYGETNSFYLDNVLSVSQSFAFPTYYIQRSELLKKSIINQELQKQVTKNALVNEIKSVYYYIRYLQKVNDILLQQDSIYQELVKASALRFQTGETNLLEKTWSEAQSQEISNQWSQNKAKIVTWSNRLTILLSTQKDYLANPELPLFYGLILNADSTDISGNPTLVLNEQNVAIEEQKIKVAKAQAMPDLTIGYTNQSLQGFYDINGSNEFANRNTRFQSLQVGISIPLWYKPHRAQIQAARKNAQAAEQDLQQLQQQLQKEFITTYQEYQRLLQAHQYYINTGLPQATMILEQSTLAFSQGDSSYLEYTTAVNQAMDIQFKYLDNLNQLNQSIFSIEFILGNQ